jgi:geranylgeranyl diphosphate synthase type II
MESIDRLEYALHDAVARVTSDGCPPRLARAIGYAVFPAGHRFRPRLCLAVAEALGAEDSDLALNAAVAVELLHGASLIQDDLPAFDDAAERRGHPALHRMFGEALAVLAADALIIGAFEGVARAAGHHPERAARLVSEIARGVGTPHGAVAGQGWESEEDIDLVQYHRAKTAALFESATACGAIAAGHDPEPWRAVGMWLGRAYQIADDISDEAGSGADGSDAVLGRPNAFRAYGALGSVRALEHAMRMALEAIPEGTGHARFHGFLTALLGEFRAQALSVGDQDAERDDDVLEAVS